MSLLLLLASLDVWKPEPIANDNFLLIGCATTNYTYILEKMILVCCHRLYCLYARWWLRHVVRCTVPSEHIAVTHMCCKQAQCNNPLFTDRVPAVPGLQDYSCLPKADIFSLGLVVFVVVRWCVCVCVRACVCVYVFCLVITSTVQVCVSEMFPMSL